MLPGVVDLDRATAQMRLIARFAAGLKPTARPAIDANSQLIKDLVVRRRQLTSLRTTEKNRRGVMPDALKPSIDRIIESLDREIASLEQLIQDAVEEPPLGDTNAISSPQCRASALRRELLDRRSA
jgi:transposase